MERGAGGVLGIKHMAARVDHQSDTFGTGSVRQLVQLAHRGEVWRDHIEQPNARSARAAADPSDSADCKITQGSPAGPCRGPSSIAVNASLLESLIDGPPAASFSLIRVDRHHRTGQRCFQPFQDRGRDLIAHGRAARRRVTAGHPLASYMLPDADRCARSSSWRKHVTVGAGPPPRATIARSMRSARRPGSG